jgi:hypothetical protein
MHARVFNTLRWVEDPRFHSVSPQGRASIPAEAAALSVGFKSARRLAAVDVSRAPVREYSRFPKPTFPIWLVDDER